MTYESDTETPSQTAVCRQSYALGRRYVLCRARDYARVYKEGQRFRGEWMTLITYCGAEATSFKYGLSVRKREYRRSVDRSRVKRRLREIIRCSRPDLVAPLWLVVIAGRGVDRARWDHLTTEFNALCTAAQCRKK